MTERVVTDGWSSCKLLHRIKLSLILLVLESFLLVHAKTSPMLLSSNVVFMAISRLI
jgi:hypothetical protein